MSSSKKEKKISAGRGYKLLSLRSSKDLKSKRDRDSSDSPEEEDTVTKSMFKKHARRLRRLKEKGLADEAYDIAELDALEKLILDLLPIAEENYRKFPIHTSASAVNHFVTTLSNIQADRRALQDLTARADRITVILDRSFDSFTRSMIDNVQRLQAEIAGKGSSKDTGELFSEFLRSMGRDLTSIKEKNNNSIMELMAAPKK